MSAVPAAASAPLVPDEIAQVTRPAKDSLWWTELELRRLGNVVASMLHSRRYERDATERRALRSYLDAMRRKAIRVMHRAEQAAGHAWPGLDPAVVDPVALADEYVSAVQRYEAAFADAPPLPAEAAAVADDDDDWAARDAREYRAALERERERDEKDGRTALLGNAGASEMRQRRAPATLSAKDEEFMRRHAPVQEQLTEQLADAVGKLKGSVGRVGDQLARDDTVLDETDAALDSNLGDISKQRDELAKYERSTSVSWWTLLSLAFVVLAIFAFVLLSLIAPW